MGPQLSRILYLSVDEAGYPRNRQIRKYLESLGHHVVVVPAPRGGAFLRRCARLYVAGRSVSPYEVVVLAEFSLQYCAVGWALARRCRARYLVDFFVGLYETNVEDWGRFRRFSIRAGIHAAVDRLALLLGDVVITDTAVRAAWLMRISPRPRKVLHVPVGAPDWAKPLPRGRARWPALRVLYYGNYVPLHGLPTVVEAIRGLAADGSISFTFIGQGELRPEIERSLASSPVPVTFREPIPELDLGSVIADHDIVLGIFGSSNKAASVIANKVWQGLACGKVVLTRESLALEELYPIAAGRLVTVPAADAQALRSALLALAEDRPEEISGEAVSQKMTAYVRRQLAALAVALFAERLRP
jgi:hypothetical protein